MTLANNWANPFFMISMWVGIVGIYIKSYIDMSLWLMGCLVLLGMIMFGFIIFILDIPKAEVSLYQEQNKLQNDKLQVMDKKLNDIFFILDEIKNN